MKDLVVGSVWNARHSSGEDIVLVLDEPKRELDDRRRKVVPCLVLTTGEFVETWLVNFVTWERVL